VAVAELVVVNQRLLAQVEQAAVVQELQVVLALVA
jgi:hypothetical protein